MDWASPVHLDLSDTGILAFCSIHLTILIDSKPDARHYAGYQDISEQIDLVGYRMGARGGRGRLARLPTLLSLNSPVAGLRNSAPSAQLREQ